MTDLELVSSANRGQRKWKVDVLSQSVTAKRFPGVRHRLLVKFNKVVFINERGDLCVCGESEARPSLSARYSTSWLGRSRVWFPPDSSALNIVELIKGNVHTLHTHTQIKAARTSKSLTAHLWVSENSNEDRVKISHTGNKLFSKLSLREKLFGRRSTRFLKRFQQIADRPGARKAAEGC